VAHHGAHRCADRSARRGHVETDRTYLPGAAEGTSDTRKLGLRVFECSADLR
jgi:hypothetical protein